MRSGKDKTDVKSAVPDEHDAVFRQLVGGGSGNAFHCQVATYFRKRGWEVLLSPYYVHNATGKAREVDLLCEQLWEFKNDLQPRVSRLLRVQLFIECTYLPQESCTVFWFDNGDSEGTRELILTSVPQFKVTRSLESTTTTLVEPSVLPNCLPPSLRREKTRSQSTWLSTNVWGPLFSWEVSLRLRHRNRQTSRPR